MKRTNVEAEKNELILQNESGDYAIIPANRRNEVLQLLEQGCYDCIDSIVASLPSTKDYAQDGLVVSNTDPPKDVLPKLLDTIGQLESDNRYDVIYGGKRNSNLTNMTINEVIQYQRDLVTKGAKSSAAGRFQFMPDTLEDLMNKGKLKGTDIFNAQTQDRLATELLNRRGLNKYLRGQITQDEFADNLAKEWAALPYNTNRSYYDKDGINKSLIDRGKFMSDIFGVTQQSVVEQEQATQPIQQQVTEPTQDNIQPTQPTTPDMSSLFRLPNENVVVMNSPYTNMNIPSVPTGTQITTKDKLNIPKDQLRALKQKLTMQGYQNLDRYTLEMAMLDNMGKLGAFSSMPMDDDTLNKLSNSLKDIEDVVQDNV